MSEDDVAVFDAAPGWAAASSSRRSLPPTVSCTFAVVMRTANTRPRVSVIRCRSHHLILDPASLVPQQVVNPLSGAVRFPLRVAVVDGLVPGGVVRRVLPRDAGALDVESRINDLPPDGARQQFYYVVQRPPATEPSRPPAVSTWRTATRASEIPLGTRATAHARQCRPAEGICRPAFTGHRPERALPHGRGGGGGGGRGGSACHT